MKEIYERPDKREWELGFERFIKEVKRRVKVIEVFPSEGSVEKIVYLVVKEMNEKYRSGRLKNFERIIEELREERKARYGSGETKIITNEKNFIHKKVDTMLSQEGEGRLQAITKLFCYIL